MNDLAPLDSLWEVTADHGTDLPLPAELRRLYGPLRFPQHESRPYIIGNFVSTLDGVVSLSLPGLSGGGPISGKHQQDRMVMGLLRAVADAVVVGAGTFRAARNHVWTPGHVWPQLAEDYTALRTNLGKTEPPLNVTVTASGRIDFDQRVFHSGEVPVLIITTPEGKNRIDGSERPQSVQVAVPEDTESLTPQGILDAISAIRDSDVILVEGGPLLIGDFFEDQRLDELFFTLAPQIAGRDGSVERPGLVSGKIFAPENPLWGNLVGIKRGESHLFLRYSFDRAAL